MGGSCWTSSGNSPAQTPVPLEAYVWLPVIATALRASSKNAPAIGRWKLQRSHVEMKMLALGRGPWTETCLGRFGKCRGRDRDTDRAMWDMGSDPRNLYRIPGNFEIYAKSSQRHALT